MHPSLAQARVLWWMVNVREFPFARMYDAPTISGGAKRVPGRFMWGEHRASDFSPVGLAQPQILPATTKALLASGWVELEDEHCPPNVVAFPRPDWGTETRALQAERRRRGQSTMRRPTVRIFPTDSGRRLTPTAPPLPWVPAINVRADTIRTEEERQRKIRRYLQR